MKYHDSTPDCHNFQHPIPQPHQPSISACLIVKDGATTLDRCLASIAPVVDEIIVVDTGSTDGSVDIARRYTDKVFSYPWHDDFAAARNESLRHATGDWVMVIDADEWLEPEIYPCLREYIRIVQTKRKQVHSLPILNAKICYPDQPALFKRTLFPNHSSLYFAGRVHEVLASELPLQNYLCHELKLQHGLIEIEKSISKQAYYHHLLVQSINEAPTAELQLHALKHLGDSYWSQGQKHFAQKLYHKYLSTLKALNLWNSSDWFITQVEQRLLTLRSKAGKLAPQLGFIASLGILTACQAAIPGNITHPNMAQRSIHSQGSQPNLEHLRKKYGPHVMIGVENPVYQKYIADKQSWPISQLQTFMATPQFQTKSIFNDNYPVGENGCPSPFAAVRTCIPQVYTGQWDQVTQCYQSGGVPIYSAQETCTRLEACPTNYYSYSTGPYGFSNYPAGYFHPRSHVESVICEGGNNNSDPDDGSEGGNEDGGGGDSGEGSGSGNIGSGCAPGKVKVDGECVLKESCDSPVLPEQLQPILNSSSPPLPSDQALQDYGKTLRQLNSVASGMQIQSFMGDFSILKKNPDKQQQRYEQLLQQQQEQRQGLNLHLEQLGDQITTLKRVYSELGVTLSTPENTPDNLDSFELQVEQHFESIKILSKDLTTSAILDSGTEYVYMLNLYRQLLQDVLSDSPILLPVDADTAPRSSIQALKRLGKQLEKAWDKIQEQHQKTDLQVNTLLQALNISASDFTETYHDNIEQSLQNSIHEAETILSNLEAQLVAETEGFSVQANNGKPQQRQKLQEQIQKVKDSLQTLKELTVDGSSYAIETAKSVEKQLRNQMQQLQNIAQKYGPDALQQVQQFYAKMDSVFGWMPQWQFSAQLRNQVIKACLKPESPLDCIRSTPLGVYEDAPYHGQKDTPRKSKRPKDGQAALANSLPNPSGGIFRIGISQNEFVVLSRTQEANPSIGRPALYHGHVRDWKGLDDWMKNELSRTGMVKVQKKGKDVTIIKDNC